MPLWARTDTQVNQANVVEHVVKREKRSTMDLKLVGGVMQDEADSKEKIRAKREFVQYNLL
jgi:hypothetical protein